MIEDAYRAELIHAWRLRRLEEAIAAVREARYVLEDDIKAIYQAKYDIGEVN